MTPEESVRFYEDQFYYRLQRRDFNKQLEEFFENKCKTIKFHKAK